MAHSFKTLRQESSHQASFLNNMLKYAWIFLLSLSSCNFFNHSNKEVEQKATVVYPKYAKGFWIEVFEDKKIIHVRNAYDTTQLIETYGIGNITNKENMVIISKPIHKIACLSTTQIGFLDLLNLTDSIVAVSDAKRIFNQKVLSNIEAGKTVAIGENGIINEEKLLTLQPSLVFAYSFSEGNSSLPKLRSLGLKIVLINDYNETHPLARAEWIKVIAAFYNQEKQADSIFNEVENQYIELSKLAQKAKKKPSVFCNLPWKEVWYMPSGKSYFAKFIEDAAGNYLWKNDTTARTLSLDFEAVYAKAAKADVWLNPNSAKTLKEIENQNRKFQHFEALKKGHVFNCNKLENQGGGNAFWETGVVLPNIVIKDLIAIFHPDILPNYQFTYYQQLPDGK